MNYRGPVFSLAVKQARGSPLFPYLPRDVEWPTGKPHESVQLRFTQHGC